MNVVVLQGRLSRSPEERVLPSGARLVAYELTSERPGEKAESVPVVWLDAPKRAWELAKGEEVLVVGRVRRRFFRAGGGTQSRTEVVADQVVLSRHPKRVQTAIEKATEALTGGLPE